MKPIDEKDLKTLKEIQDNNKDIIEKEKKINTMIEQIMEEQCQEQK